MNRDKFASARKWCNDRGIIFDIWTEKHLQQRGQAILAFLLANNIAVSSSLKLDIPLA